MNKKNSKELLKNIFWSIFVNYMQILRGYKQILLLSINLINIIKFYFIIIANITNIAGNPKRKLL